MVQVEHVFHSGYLDCYAKLLISIEPVIRPSEYFRHLHRLPDERQ